MQEFVIFKKPRPYEEIKRFMAKDWFEALHIYCDWKRVHGVSGRKYDFTYFEIFIRNEEFRTLDMKLTKHY